MADHDETRDPTEPPTLDQRRAEPAEEVDDPVARPREAADDLIRDLRHEVAPVVARVRRRPVARAEQPEAVGDQVVVVAPAREVERVVGHLDAIFDRWL